MVSIHAPLRGATLFPVVVVSVRWAFQSTHPCGVRRYAPFVISNSYIKFQSTHPCGVRRTVHIEKGFMTLVSIHAPLRGATSWSAKSCFAAWCFNPRTPAGCDQQWKGWQLQQVCFNPRTPAGCDCFLVTVPAIMAWFQSTHPCGVRLAMIDLAAIFTGVSIHAPLRGATC